MIASNNPFSAQPPADGRVGSMATINGFPYYWGGDGWYTESQWARSAANPANGGQLNMNATMPVRTVYDNPRAQSIYADQYTMLTRQGYDAATADRLAREGVGNHANSLVTSTPAPQPQNAAAAPPAAPANAMTQPTGYKLATAPEMAYAYTKGPATEPSLADRIRAANAAKLPVQDVGMSGPMPDGSVVHDPIFDQQYKNADGSLMDMSTLTPEARLAHDKWLADEKLREQATLKTQREGYALDIAKQYFPDDQKAQAAFITEYMNGLNSSTRTIEETLRVAKSAGDRWVNDPFRFVTEHLDNAINGDPTGILAGLAKTGVGVTAGAAAGAGNVAPGVSIHTGSGMPATPPPDPAGLGIKTNEDVNKAAADNPSVTPVWHNGTQQIEPGYPFTPVADTIGPERPGDVQLADIKAPIYPTPTGGQIPQTPPPGTPGVTTPPPPTGTPSPATPPAPSGADAAGAAAAGAGAAAAGGGAGDLGALAVYGVGGLLGGAGALAAGKIQADAATEAAKAQATASGNALDEFKRQFDAQRKDLAPWRTAGMDALGYGLDANDNVIQKEGGLRTFDQDNTNPYLNQKPFEFNMAAGPVGSDGWLQANPMADKSYSFRLSEGLKALQNSAAQKGGLLSGNTLKGINDYAAQSASQEWQNAFARDRQFQQDGFNRHQANIGMKLNRLQSMAGIGQSAIQQTNAARQDYAGNVGNTMMNNANNQSQGTTGAANAMASGIMGGVNSGVNAMSGLMNYYNSQALMNMLAKR